MPYRGKYYVNDGETVKAANGNDQSYRNCISTLIIFFFLCILLILASLPWRANNVPEDSHVADKTSREELYGNKFKRTTYILSAITKNDSTTSSILETTTTPTEKEKVSTTASTVVEDNMLLTSYNEEKTTEVVTYLEDLSLPSVTFSEQSTTDRERDKMSEDPQQSTTVFFTDLTDNVISTEDDTSDKMTVTSTSTEVEMTVTDNYENMTSESETSNFDDQQTFRYLDDTSTSEITSIGMFGNITDRISTDEDTTNTINTEMLSSTSYHKDSSIADETTLLSTITELSVSTEYNDDLLVSDTTEDNVNATSVNYNTYEYFTGSDGTTIEIFKNLSTAAETETETSTLSTTFLPHEEYTEYSSSMFRVTEERENYIVLRENITRNEKCSTPQCKHVASKVLAYMNHSANPCEDFYEFACGGLEADPQILERNLENKAYQRILGQMRKKENKRLHFTAYYNSCVNYDKHVNLSQRIHLAKQELSKIGTFYITSHNSNSKDFTNLFAKLILNDGALLFDIVPDLEDVYNPKQYTLRIGPPLPESIFNEEGTDDPCYTAELDIENKYIDLGQLYSNYRSCKSNTGRFIQSISEALETLGVFDKYNASQYIQQTLINIDLEILKGFFMDYPTADVIRKAYLTKDYTEVTLRELNAACTLVNWTELIHSLTGLYIDPNATLYVYFYKQVINGLRKLETFAKENGNWQLNNVLLGLYTRNLYQHLVVSKHRLASDSCLRAASTFMPITASRLYMSSFSDSELTYMNRTIYELFGELKDTLRSNIQNAEWTDAKGLKELDEKINDIALFVPDVEYFSKKYLKSETAFIDRLNLSDNYFLNSMKLLQMHRSLKYEGVKTEEVGPQQIWTHYATPFQTKGMSIYGLNCVIVPFGAIDWSIFFDKTKPSLDYLTLATLGNLIAYQIAHHFDANGIHYWNGTVNSNSSLLYDSEFTTTNFEDYVNCQKHDLYRKPVKMVLPFTGQTVSFQISQLALNERLSEVMGLRLAYDTLVRLNKDLNEPMVLLPWLEFNIEQTFYLIYAQTYCTKMPLTSSYVTIYENEQLPSRVRVFISVSSNKPFGEVWRCQTESENDARDTCDVFPYLKPKEAFIISE